MKIILFQFYSPNPCPDYDEMGSYLTSQGHIVYVTHMTKDKKLRLNCQTEITELDIFPWAIKNAKHLKFFARRVAFITFMLRLRKLIKHIKPDIFMVATSDLMYLSLLPVFMSGEISFIYDVRQLGLNPGISFKIKLKNIKFRFNMWFLSQFIYDHSCFAFKDAAQLILGINWINKRSSVMEVGVNHNFFKVPKPAKKINHEKLQLVYIGSLARVRKLEFIIDSAEQLIKKTKDFHITFIGPDLENYYHSYLVTRNLQDYVTILDAIPYSDVPKTLVNYHVAIAYVPEHPDWHYQPTLKVKEYCALGLPIVATDNLPNRVFVKENETGLLFQNKEEDFCNTVFTLIKNNILLNSLHDNASISRNGITWDDSARKYETLFLNLRNQVKQ